MAVTKEQFRALFAVVKDQLEQMSKEQIIEYYLDSYFELSSKITKSQAQRVMGAMKKHAESSELKKIFMKICFETASKSEFKNKKLRFSDISKTLAKARPEIEWLGAGMKRVEAGAKIQFKKSIGVSRWLTEFNKYHTSKGDISK
ncbi:hypothetical protein ICN49_08775 [Polynucleobacter sp. MWH-Mekk-B1]|uniref:hypothetical protein n=1 Tax=Polynucleobacter finlandensis TaxID=1855894 RepID=UPI001C0E4E58|nr:hypothetical protein [Polynucleobacter finlandensis]MBU3545009.1 hypothetical protein [Polynucleobacter finlandensis]